MNIIFIGFMGCGKTTIGRKLATRLGYWFIDTDHLIEQEQRRTVRQIFDEDGEPAFRQMETDLLKRLRAVNNTIIATGGGIVGTPGNLDLIRNIGTSVYLKTDVDEIYRRVSRNKKRPLLLTDDPKKTISDLLEKRQHLYMQADKIIETGSEKIQHIVSNIIQQL